MQNTDDYKVSHTERCSDGETCGETKTENRERERERDFCSAHFKREWWVQRCCSLYCGLIALFQAIYYIPARCGLASVPENVDLALAKSFPANADGRLHDKRMTLEREKERKKKNQRRVRMRVGVNNRGSASASVDMC